MTGRFDSNPILSFFWLASVRWYNESSDRLYFSKLIQYSKPMVSQYSISTNHQRVDRSKLAILKSKYFQKATRNMQFIDLMDVLPDELKQIF